MKKVLFGVFAAFTLSACGGFNLADCEEAETKVKTALNDCFDGAGDNYTLSCDTYEANASAYASCKFSEYYEELGNYVTCNDGTIEYGTVPTLSCN